jgi:hypothetical protein
VNEGAWARWSDWAWALARRIHLGTQQPANWVQLFKFGVVGGSGYVVNIVVFALLTQAAELHHIPAAVGAFGVAVTNNFAWNRAWTFRTEAPGRHPAHQGARFLTVSVRQPGAPRGARERRRPTRAAEPGDRRRGGDAGELRRQQALDVRVGTVLPLFAHTSCAARRDLL